MGGWFLGTGPRDQPEDPERCASSGLSENQIIRYQQPACDKLVDDRVNELYAFRQLLGQARYVECSERRRTAEGA
jgi:hypothetical protein